MKIASFNVNSVRARLPNLLDWLATAQPDIVFLQEIKVETEGFPAIEGYQALVHGQKAYNGVAILSKMPLEQVSTTVLPGDEQARYLEARLGDLTLMNIYAPNGNPVESEKFPYKLRWLEALYDRASALLAMEQKFLIGGDFNIIPEPKDCHNPAAWEGDALFRPETRTKWRALANLGLYDAFRVLHPDATHAFTFWDYQAGCWPKDAGIRIDHFLLSPSLTDRLTACTIDEAPRGLDKASDHTPLILEIAS
jgi:exodeoxyribonuclease-3